MPRAVVQYKAKAELGELSRAQLNAEIGFLKQREELAGRSAVAKSYRKRREVAEKIRKDRFDV
jgi:hypothetical protein